MSSYSWQDMKPGTLKITGLSSESLEGTRKLSPCPLRAGTTKRLRRYSLEAQFEKKKKKIWGTVEGEVVNNLTGP